MYINIIMSNKGNCLVVERNSNILKMVKLRNEIEYLQKKNDDIDKILWKECMHDWVLDPACASDDLCKKKCAKCGLYYCKYLYT